VESGQCTVNREQWTVNEERGAKGFESAVFGSKYLFCGVWYNLNYWKIESYLEDLAICTVFEAV
jgi:hypothetical protein